jgi:enoyl-CoA hydratase/carnithine racemase
MMDQVRTNQPVLHEQADDGVVTLIMARGEKRNSLTEELLDALHEAIDRLSEDNACRVIIIAAEGPVFCAGHDIGELTAARADKDGGEGYFARIFSKSSGLMKKLMASPRPVIAQVQGPTSAAGCQLVASADLAVAADHAQFTTPGVDIGLFCSTPMVAVSRNLNRKQSMAMLLTGDPIDAHQAQAMGLVNNVVDQDTLETETMTLARKIAAKPQATIALGKQAFYGQIETNVVDAYELTQRTMIKNMLNDDAREGLGAFLEKRKPDWRDH